MNTSEIHYLNETIRSHVSRFFTKEASTALDYIPLIWCTFLDAASPLKRAVYIPTDVSHSTLPNQAWKVPFGNTHLTFWNPLKKPSPEWVLDNPDQPLWYTHPSGAIMPAWNLARTLFDLLTLKEECLNQQRDQHNRVASNASPRASVGLLESPIFNDSVAALIAACVGLKRTGRPAVTLQANLVTPPVLVLSHDLDQLRGNDIWTQTIRLSRILLNPTKIFLFIFTLWFTLLNAIIPRRYYFDNIVGMIEIERMLGFTSTLYFLNGSGGRFGARSGASLIPRVVSITPNRWGLGMHYNYDTHLKPAAFVAQQNELNALLGQNIVAGRAHYLRFDPINSWRFYVDMGIRVDETLGYNDIIGYRAGIAGPFKPYDSESGVALPLLEMPLVVMESCLLTQYPDRPVDAFMNHLKHIKVVGGAVSLLFHPGQFNNPEYPVALGLYRRLLGCARAHGAISINAKDL